MRTIVFVAFDNITLQDLIGPFEVLSRLRDTTAIVAGVGSITVVSDRGFRFTCDTTLDEIGACDMLLVPGGPGINALLDSPSVLAKIEALGAAADFVTSVCTGALVLGAAGLLRGYRATTFWRYRDLLELTGAIPTQGRVVVDRNRITGGGVTAGLDFALTLVEMLEGRDAAREIALGIEYDPHSPVEAGTPQSMPETIVDRAVNDTIHNYEQRRALLSRLQLR